ncbi:hypothetical protein HU200_010217 [Digitaria exilis]|uniref:F-box domain-containing protein n=1 Tax=Digitaria exilis TaxID=1010633 RepID=A0A835FIW9_9POAL|nr:hypothetical protein HU200_010217 [Digitaria exilis]
MAGPGACGECRKHRSTTWWRVRFLRRSADDADYISALPDDLLLQILGRLGCARTAANMSLLSRRWRGLWARSPAFDFHRITPGQLHAALGRIVPPAGSLRIFIPRHHMLSPSRISSLLAAAAPLAPAELAVDIHTDKRFRSSSSSSSSDADGVELPCLDRTTSLTLHFSPRVRLPPAGQFTALESLSFGGCHIALGELLPRCPFLRKLCLSSWRFDSLTVHSPSLQELDVSAAMQLQGIDIVVPMLKKLKFRALEDINNASSISLSAPLVDDLSWLCLGPKLIGLVSYGSCGAWK